MLLANVLQRGIGFVRNLSFCRFLDQDHLGFWAMSSSFFVLAAPLAILGLPGTLGRLVETFRIRGQLLTFLTRIFTVSLVSTLAFCALLLAFHDSLGQWILGVEVSLATMLLVVLTLGAVIAFNVTTELMNGLRQSRVASMMHSSNSIAFTVLSLPLLLLWPDWRVLVFSFGLAGLIGLWPALRHRTLIRSPNESSPPTPLAHHDMWRRVIPLAISIWVMNLLVNLFDVVDRYALLYLAPTRDAGAAMVGQFHSAKTLPLLLSSLTGLISTMLLPYLVADWEAGRRDRVRSSLQLSVKGAGYLFFLLSTGALLICPWIFESILAHKYQAGMNAMPLALVCCCVMATSAFLQNYFWCAEKGRFIQLTTALGLAVNIVLNIVLVPNYELMGAIGATTLASMAILIFNLCFLLREGISLDRASYWMCFLPVGLLGGPLIATFVGAGLFALASRTSLIFNTEEKESLDDSVTSLLRKLGIRIPSIWFSSR
jgi:polysaccharide transporter, PST family